MSYVLVVFIEIILVSDTHCMMYTYAIHVNMFQKSVKS